MNNDKRAKRLNKLIGILEAGQSVSRRDLLLVLLPDEWRDYEADEENAKQYRLMLRDVPSELVRYAEMLKKGDFFFARAEALSGKSEHRILKKLYHQSEHAFELALEHLEECLNLKPELAMWLDRTLEDGNKSAEEHCSLDPGSVPRLITSLSAYNKKTIESEWDARRRLKLAALRDSLARTASEPSNPEPTIRPMLQSRKSKHDFSKFKF